MFGHTLLALAMLAAQTDQTVQVRRGARLEVHNFSGAVTVRVWDRDQVRVQVEHSDRDTIDVQTTETLVSVRARARSAPPRSLDYTLTVPSWMPVSVSGTATDVDVDGTVADVTIETVKGDVKVRGGAGFVRLQSVQGSVSVERSKGRVEAHTLNDSIHLADITGDVSAETINGGITLERIDASSVDASTVNGEISYDGQIKDRGLYRLTSHNGPIDVTVPDRANATVTVRTFNGEVTSTLPVKIEQSDKHRRTLTTGNGSARVEIESFNGEIVLRRPGDPKRQRERNRR
jgi:putative adhesin